jgi:hypothetical protein
MTDKSIFLIFVVFLLLAGLGRAFIAFQVLAA